MGFRLSCARSRFRVSSKNVLEIKRKLEYPSTPVGL